LEEAVASAFGRTPGEVRKANLLLGNIGEVALLAASDKLAEASLVPFRPVKFMLATPEETSGGIWEHIGAAAGTVWLEDKYDGVRCQAHKQGRRVALFSRDLKEVTATFLELADALSKLEQDFVLDGEIVAMRGEQVLPFGELQRRLGRREDDLFMREEVPIKLVAFDLLWTGGETLLDCALAQRRQRLEALGPRPDTLRLAQVTEARGVDEIDTAFEAARARGNEGLMIKDPSSLYAPGRRGQAWLKLKKALATLDCVVVGAEYGHGKRSKVLSDYTFAVRDETSGQLKTIGKAYTGLTDVEIASLTEHFLHRATHQHGRYFEVPPDTILEIAFDRIQPSSRHSSGLALRFPRIVRVRTDKSLAEIDTLETARRLAEKLAGHSQQHLE
jgi:DNA ligase-1